MPDSADDSKSKTLLDPELNPITNPLLAAHMGRWAEVYFTSPPDKRDQAVAELVRELSGKARSTYEPSAEPQQHPIEETDSFPQEDYESLPFSADFLHPPAVDPPLPTEKFPPPSPVPDPPFVEDAPEVKPEVAAPQVEFIEPEALIAETDAEEIRSRTVNETPEEIPGERPDEPLIEGPLIEESSFEEPSSLKTSLAEIRDAELSSTAASTETLENEEPDDAPVVCQSCGHLNRAGQRFCGMCGTPMENVSAPLPFSTADEDLIKPSPVEPTRKAVAVNRPVVPVSERAPQQQRSSATLENSGPKISAGVVSKKIDQAVQEENRRGPEPAENPSATLFHVRDQDSDPPPRNYRLYIAVIVVALIAWLVYSMWRGNSSQDIGAPTTELPSASADSASPSRTAAPQKSAPAATEPDDATPKSAPPAQKAAKPQASAEPASPDKSALPKAASQTETAPVAGTDQNGAEELANAQRSLREGNSRQAVNWLWKSIAKENSSATILLSEMYLKGEGVPKSCDQARLLLSAAARKGQPSAAQRLRGLPAYGCQ